MRLYICNTQLKLWDERRFREGRIYKEDEIPLPDLKSYFDYIGEGPPELGELNAKEHVGKCAQSIREWVRGPVAERIRSAEGCLDSYLRQPLEQLLDAAVLLGRTERPKFERSGPFDLSSKESEMLVALNTLIEWAGEQPDNTDWPRQSDVAKKLGIHKVKVNRLIKAGDLKTNGQTGDKCRVDPASILAYCDREGIAYNDT